MIGFPQRRSALIAIGAVTLLAGVAIGASTFAADGEGGGSSDAAPPGSVITSDSAPTPGFQAEAVTTSGTNYDPTILTKFINGRGFVASQGPPAGADDDFLDFVGQTCVSPANDAGSGTVVTAFAPVELPDGARIKQVKFYGQDTNAGLDASISLNRSNFAVPATAGPITRDETQVTSFSTSGSPGATVVASDDNLNDVAGTMSDATGTAHHFHNVRVQFPLAASSTLVLCGVEVLYQIPAPAGDPGVVYHPITPVRAFDSRLAGYAQAGVFGPGASRIVSIADGHDLLTGAVTLANAVPANATAITYNLTSAESTGPNFLAITPGNAASFGASAINFNGTSAIANGGTVPIAADRTVKIWVGGSPASTHVVVDVTGYYTAALPLPNMAG